MRDLIPPKSRIRFGPYEADLQTQELWKYGTRIKLVGQPFAILRVLVSRPGELVTREELRELLWPSETFVDFNHGLNAAVNKVRDVLSDSAADPRYIETLPRRGYRFIAEVETDAKSASETPAAVPPGEEVLAVSQVPAETQEALTPKGRVRWRKLVLALVSVAVATVFIGWGISELASSRREKASKEGKNSYASYLTMNAPLKGAQVVLVTGGINEGPRFSSDGKRMVFMSTRGNNGKELWVADASGANAKQLTTVGNAGSPTWSPDGSRIAFDSSVNGRTVVMTISSSGGQPSILVGSQGDNSVPSWSHDGSTVYFASNRTSQFEIWQVSATGGEPKQLTHDGGFAPEESEDGQTIYYAKSQFPQPVLWRYSLQNQVEAPLWPSIRPGTWASWGLAKTGILYVEEGPGNVAVLSFFDLQTQKLRQLTMLGRFPFWLSSTRDGHKVVFDRVDSENTTSLVALEDFE